MQTKENHTLEIRSGDLKLTFVKQKNTDFCRYFFIHIRFLPGAGLI